jgi:hypothetical protein
LTEPADDPFPPATLAVVGDVHGHLQLALCMLARWQVELGTRFDCVLLCGDVGAFSDGSQLDNATVRHAKANPCELEFLTQWSASPPPPWLAHVFLPRDGGQGLGLECPVVMVHGNHEGFAHLETLPRGRRPVLPVQASDLPAVDTDGYIRLLPSGWTMATPGGCVVAGVGGMERGQRRSQYHEMAYIDDAAVEALCDGPSVDVLVTHQGPAALQGDLGSPTLDLLLNRGLARAWFHGHATPNPAIVRAGPGGGCTVVPLGDVAFGSRGHRAEDPGLDGWSHARVTDDAVHVVREAPPFWRDYRRGKWKALPEGLVCPDLVPFVPRP